MPRASDELRAKFPGSDTQALALLESRGYKMKGHAWALPSPGYVMKEDEADAVDYLCDEWDYNGVIL
jgi:hypothetical protein